MPLSEPIKHELEAMRQRLLEMLVPLQTPEDVARDSSTAQERLRRALWSAVRELDPLLSEAQVPADLDLTINDSATQQVLYNFVVREYFSLHLLDDPGDIDIPAHSPEECQLRVFFEYGRWFVTWLKRGEEDAGRPEAQARELLVFAKDQNGQFVFNEV
jgi:hypothetical protein